MQLFNRTVLEFLVFVLLLRLFEFEDAAKIVINYIFLFTLLSLFIKYKSVIQEELTKFVISLLLLTSAHPITLMILNFMRVIDKKTSTVSSQVVRGKLLKITFQQGSKEVTVFLPYLRSLRKTVTIQAVSNEEVLATWEHPAGIPIDYKPSDFNCEEIRVKN